MKPIEFENYVDSMSASESYNLAQGYLDAPHIMDVRLSAHVEWKHQGLFGGQTERFFERYDWAEPVILSSILLARYSVRRLYEPDGPWMVGSLGYERVLAQYPGDDRIFEAYPECEWDGNLQPYAQSIYHALVFSLGMNAYFLGRDTYSPMAGSTNSPFPGQ